jgi:hypothetical protein
MQQLLIKLVKQRLEWFDYEWNWKSYRGTARPTTPGRA